MSDLSMSRFLRLKKYKTLQANGRAIADGKE